MKIIISGFFGHSNLGDDLLLDLTISLFSKGNELYIINPGSDLKENDLLSDNIKILRLSKKCLFKYNFDCIIYSGGGLFPSLHYPLRAFLGYTKSFLCVKRVIVLGCGIVPKKGIFSNFFFKLFLKSCSDVSVRDNVSKLYAERLLKKTISNIGDLYFSKKLVESENRRENKTCLICLCQPLIELELNDSRKKEKYDLFIERVNEIVSYIKSKGYSLTFLLFSKKYDRMLIDNLVMGGLDQSFSVVQEGKDFALGEIDSYMQQYELALCMRFHSHVLCIRNNIPFISICYDYKSSSLLEESGLRNVSVDFGIRTEQYFGRVIDLDVEKLKENFDYVVEHKSELIEKMKLFSASKYQITNGYINMIKTKYNM